MIRVMAFESLASSRESKESVGRSGRAFTMSGGSAEERTQATEVLYKRRNKALEERVATVEDTETEEMLGTINMLIQAEYDRISIVESPYVPVRIEEVQGVREVDKGDAGSMVYDDMLDIIQYKMGQPTIEKFVGLLHESIHTTQKTEFTPMWKSYGASKPEPTIFRGGYMTGEGHEDPRGLLKWLNEAVVHTRTLDLIRRNVALLVRQFPGTSQESWCSADARMYDGSQRLFKEIITAIAVQSGIDEQVVEDDFFRRHVSGDMSHLDIFDTLYGGGAKQKLERINYRELDSKYEDTVRPILSVQV